MLPLTAVVEGVGAEDNAADDEAGAVRDDEPEEAADDKFSDDSFDDSRPTRVSSEPLAAAAGDTPNRTSRSDRARSSQSLV